MMPPQNPRTNKLENGSRWGATILVDPIRTLKGKSKNLSSEMGKPNKIVRIAETATLAGEVCTNVGVKKKAVGEIPKKGDMTYGEIFQKSKSDP